MQTQIPKYIYHYYELAKGPFRNISAINYSEAQQIIKDTKVGFNKNRDSNYLDMRLDLEEKLQRSFVAKGGKPTRKDPFYFSLGECKWLETWFEHTGIVKIPFELFANREDIVSITYPDSMISFQLAEEDQFRDKRKSCNGQVFILEELQELIDQYGLPSEEKWKNDPAHHFDRYVEVQIWDYEPIQQYLNSI